MFRERARRLFRTAPARALAPLVLVLLVGAIFHKDGAFYAWETHRSTLRWISMQGILACGMTVVILSGGIDLSVGSVLGLSAVSFALLALPVGLPAPVAALAVLAMGATLGAVSGVFVARYRLQPFIVTLAMMAFARGLAKFLSGGEKITSSTALHGAPPVTRELPALIRAL